MNRDEFRDSLLVALAGSEHVSAYERTSKTGKTVHVGAYTRDPGKMSNTDLFKEYKSLTSGTPAPSAEGGPATPEQSKNRLAQIVTEIRKRKAAGTWGHTRQSDVTKAQNKVSGAPSTGHSTATQFEQNKQTPAGPLTDPEYDAHVQKVRAILSDPANQKYDTQSMYGIRDPETGKVIEGLYTPERTEQHKQIINDILSKAQNVPTDRKAIMSGGLGGAGKGYVLQHKAGVNHDDYLTIDPDQMKSELLKRGMAPEVPGLLPMEHAAFIHEESSDLAKLLQQVAMDKGMNIILDTTMADAKKTKPKIEQFHDNGYEVEGVFADVPIATSIESALGRHRGGVDRFRAGEEKGHGDLGGRFVPPEYIQSAAPEEGSQFHSKNRQAFEDLKNSGLFTRTRVFDNSDRRAEEHGGGPKLVHDAEHPNAPRARTDRLPSAVLDRMQKNISDHKSKQEAPAVKSGSSATEQALKNLKSATKGTPGIKSGMPKKSAPQQSRLALQQEAAAIRKKGIEATPEERDRLEEIEHELAKGQKQKVALSASIDNLVKLTRVN